MHVKRAKECSRFVTKKFVGALKVVTSNMYFSNIVFLLTFIKVWLILIQKNKDS